MKNVLTELDKSVLTPLRLTVSATDAGIQKKMFVADVTTLIIPNE